MSTSTEKLLVLGGYGGTGRPLCRLLLERTSVRVVVAGRRKEAAERVARELAALFPGRVESAVADASDAASLAKAFQGIRAVIVASTTADHARCVAEAALAAGVDYVDQHFQQDVVEALQPLEARARQAGRLLLTQAGFHPGLPAAFVRFAVPLFDQLETARVAMALNGKMGDASSVVELVDAIGAYDGEVCEGGVWRRGTYRDAIRFDFGERFGLQSCMPLKLAEMRSLPVSTGARQLGVYVAGFDFVTDWFIAPVIAIAYWVRKGLGRRLFARVLAWSMDRSADKRPSGVAFALEAKGRTDGVLGHVRVRADHKDASLFTAVAVVTCVQQYLDGLLPSSGLHMMGLAVDPIRLLTDLQRMGTQIHMETEGSTHALPVLAD